MKAQNINNPLKITIMKAEILNVRNEMNSILREVGYKTNKVAVEIYGKLFYLDEAHIRALQVVAMQKAEESDEAFKEFTDNVVVYSGATKRRSKYTMTFKKTGGFIEKFEPGFVDVCTELDMKITRAEFKAKREEREERRKNR